MKEIENALETLKSGGVILHLTDTIWGLACDPTNDLAIEKIQKIKHRAANKSFILLISEIGQLYNYVEKVPEIAWDIVEFAEEPLTIIYPKGKNVSEKVLAADGSIAIRLVKDKECLSLLAKFKKGLVSTSANISGAASPFSYDEIDSQVLNAVDYVVPSKAESKKKASKIIKLGIDGTFQIIRS
jgi:L-threonylcarbamoyladenylate synthase